MCLEIVVQAEGIAMVNSLKQKHSGVFKWIPEVTVAGADGTGGKEWKMRLGG